MRDLKFATLNHLWCALIVEELYRLGVRDCCIAPGSRSAPLVMEMVRAKKMRCQTHFDERGLGFLALGLAKGSKRPVVVITTSGSALANLYPAVVEASLTDIPLILLTADRPVELLHCGANQAIAQTGIFAHFCKNTLNLPPPDACLSPTFVLGSVDNVYYQQQRQVGPLHINCMLREPLYLEAEPFDGSAILASIEHWRKSSEPYTRNVLSLQSLECHPDWFTVANEPGVIIVGQIDDPNQAQALFTWARKLGWPILTDIQSQLAYRSGVCHSFDLYWESPVLQQSLCQAKTVLQFGGRLISKNLQSWLKKRSWANYWFIDALGERLDPGHLIGVYFHCEIDNWLAAHPVLSRANEPHDLTNFDLQMANRLAARLADDAFDEITLVYWVGRACQGKLFIGNSMPVRLLDCLPLSGDGPSRIVTNRGASGIDGLLASCCGLAASGDEPTTLLIGDLSLLHDLNSLALAAKSSSPLVLILINNGGGSIFRLLPVPREDDLLETYFELSHQWKAKGAAEMFNIPYCSPSSLGELQQAYQTAFKRQGATLIELHVSQSGSDLLPELKRLANGDT